VRYTRRIGEFIVYHGSENTCLHEDVECIDQHPPAEHPEDSTVRGTEWHRFGRIIGG
jgi:hypothetical protein